MGESSRFPTPERIRVLHVDDDPSVTEVVAAYLEREEAAIEVDSENDAERALERLEAGDYDCVVSDFQMPGLDGLELLQAVREDHPDLPFVLFTGEGSEHLAGEAISAGVTDYIQKGGTEQYTLLANRVVKAVEGYRATRQLRRQTDLFEKTQHIAGVGGWEYDIQRDEVTWTTGMYDILGVDRDESLTLDRVAELFHPDDESEIRSAFRRALGEEGSYDLEVRAEPDEGEVRWIRIRGELQYEDGRKARLRGTVQDVTERRQREERLRRHTATIEALHNAATDIAAAETVEEIAELTVSTARNLLDFRLCSVLYLRDEMLEPVAVSEDSPEGGARPVPVEEGEGGLAGKTYRTGESYVLDEVSPDDDSEPASEQYQSGMSVPIGDSGVFQAVAYEPGQFGQEDVERAELLTAHTASAFDRLEREQKLRERNQRLDQFASVVSHDLRNPLQVLRGSLELARETGDVGHLDDAVDSVDRMDHIVTDLLAIARQGKEVTDPESLNLATVVEGAWETVETGESTLDVEGGLDRVVVADGGRLRQLLENLFRNAVEHGSTNDRRSDDAGDTAIHDSGDGNGTPTLSVRVGWIDDPPGFFVADDGPGIPPKEREAVFETGHSTQEDGTGFGLAIAERVAAAHGWSIAAEESESGGARFEVTDLETR